MTTAPGLRDRKKAATRAALANAAAELARDHGLHAVTADAIAARAGVSTRTFHNYFASKEEAFLVHIETRVEEWIELLRDRPRDEHILDSLLATALAVVCSSEWQFDEIVACIAYIEEGNVLSAHRIEVERRSSRRLIEIIAERTDTDPVTDLRPSLLNYAAMGAMRAAMEMYIEGSTARSAEDLVRDAFTQLRRGFP